MSARKIKQMELELSKHRKLINYLLLKKDDDTSKILSGLPIYSVFCKSATNGRWLFLLAVLLNKDVSGALEFDEETDDPISLYLVDALGIGIKKEEIPTYKKGEDGTTDANLGEIKTTEFGQVKLNGDESGSGGGWDTYLNIPSLFRNSSDELLMPSSLFRLSQYPIYYNSSSSYLLYRETNTNPEYYNFTGTLPDIGVVAYIYRGVNRTLNIDRVEDINSRNIGDFLTDSSFEVESGTGYEWHTPSGEEPPTDSPESHRVIFNFKIKNIPIVIINSWLSGTNTSYLHEKNYASEETLKNTPYTL